MLKRLEISRPKKFYFFLVGEEAIVAYRRVEFPVHWGQQKISRQGGG